MKEDRVGRPFRQQVVQGQATSTLCSGQYLLRLPKRGIRQVRTFQALSRCPQDLDATKVATTDVVVAIDPRLLCGLQRDLNIAPNLCIIETAQTTQAREANARSAMTPG